MSRFFLGLFIALGLSLGGWFIGDGFNKGRSGARYVDVKGVAERDVTADLAIWPIRFVETGNDLAAVQARIEADRGKVVKFLRAQGLAAGAITIDSLDVTDLFAQPYRSGPIENRFIVAQTLMVRTDAVDTVRKASQNVSALVAQQVVLSNQGPSGGGPYYLFTGLSRIKPDMIHEATLHARAAARQFAKDSNSSLGAIRRADQGTFVILARDKAPGISEQTQPLKTVRVVSHLQFYLLD